MPHKGAPLCRALAFCAPLSRANGDTSQNVALSAVVKRF